MLRYTSEPLSDDAEVSGHPIIDLCLSASEGDAAVHVYLSEVEEGGTVRYVTEGVLRAIHRKESVPEPLQRWSWPFRTFARADAGLPLRTAPHVRDLDEALLVQEFRHPGCRSPQRGSPGASGAGSRHCHSGPPWRGSAPHLRR